MSRTKEDALKYLESTQLRPEPVEEWQVQAVLARWRQEEEALCLKCGDKQFVHPRLPSGKINYEQVVPCFWCSTISLSELEERRFARAGIPVGYTDKTFENFAQVEGAKGALEAVSLWALGDVDYHMLLIYGGVGNGKTHLACAAINAASRRGVAAKYYAISDVFASMRKQMEIEDGKVEAVMDALKGVPFLALDDMPTRYDTDWQIARLSELIDYRYREQKHTLFVTNRDLRPSQDAAGRKIDPLPEQILRRFREGGVGRTILNEAKEYRVATVQKGTGG